MIPAWSVLSQSVSSLDIVVTPQTESKQTKKLEHTQITQKIHLYMPSKLNVPVTKCYNVVLIVQFCARFWWDVHIYIYNQNHVVFTSVFTHTSKFSGAVPEVFFPFYIFIYIFHSSLAPPHQVPDETSSGSKTLDILSPFIFHHSHPRFYHIKHLTLEETI